MNGETLRRLAEQPYETTLREIEWGRFDELQRRFGIRRSIAYELPDERKLAGAKAAGVML